MDIEAEVAALKAEVAALRLAVIDLRGIIAEHEEQEHRPEKG